MSALPFVSDTFDPTRWRDGRGLRLFRITYHRGISRGPEADGRPEGADMPVVRIAFDRPDIRNAFRPRARSTSCTARSTTRARPPRSRPSS